MLCHTLVRDRIVHDRIVSVSVFFSVTQRRFFSFRVQENQEWTELNGLNQVGLLVYKVAEAEIEYCRSYLTGQEINCFGIK
jgi:hypothetical protein